MSATVKCAWRNCDKQIEPVTESGDERKYCSAQHKKKASGARLQVRRGSTVEEVQAHVIKSSGYYFAKMMEGAERIAATHGHDEDAVKDLMVNAFSQRIAVYRVEVGL